MRGEMTALFTFFGRRSPKVRCTGCQADSQILYAKGDVNRATDEPSSEDICAVPVAGHAGNGLGGTRTHNQRLKRALTCIHKLLMCCPLRRSKLIIVQRSLH